MTATIAGRTAIVTGAGRGLGAGIAEALLAHGARVILVGRSLERLEETRLGLSPSAGTAGIRVERCDVSDARSVAGLVDQCADEDVSILVNNAGIAGPVAPLPDIQPGDWDEVFAVNVRSVYLMCRAFLPAMVASGRGDVINLASVSGKRPLAGRTAYCASKMALIGLTRTLAVEVGPAGVRVNSLSPGPVRSERMRRNFELESRRLGISYEDAEAAFVSRAAMGRLVEPGEVADAVVAMLGLGALCGADLDLSAGMVAP